MIAHIRTGALIAGSLLLGIWACGERERSGVSAAPSEVEAYVYPEPTSTAFAELLATPAWSAPEPSRNAKGMLLAEHRATGLSFVLVPRGKFLMGAPDDQPGRQPGTVSDEGPVHEVKVPAFLMCTTECTIRAWDRIGGDDERFNVGPEVPINEVTWTAVKTWCSKAGLRLPSESEWEYACRAGSTSVYHFGDDPARLSEFAWSGSVPKPMRHKGSEGQPVACLKPNAWGLFDFHGLVDEWCEDLYHPNYEGAPSDGSPWTEGEGDRRVVRDGSYGQKATVLRCAERKRARPDSSDRRRGFRPAADLP